MQWGNVPGWIEALATVGALVAAIVAVRASWRVLGIEQARERDRLVEGERAEQADRVAAWLSLNPALTVLNGSSLPVYDVEIRIYGEDGEHLTTGKWSVLAPGMLELGAVALEPLGKYFRIDLATRQRGSLVMVFRDSAGRTWHRDAKGLLTKA